MTALADPAPRDEPPREPGRPPGAGELFRWAALLLAISLVVAAIAIPLLRWFGLGD